MKYRNRVVGLIEIRGDRILANPKNFRPHPEQQRAVMRGALVDVGIGDGLKAVPVDEALIREVLSLQTRDERIAWARRFEVGGADVMLLDGHLRAEEIRDQPIPVLLLDLLPHEQAEFLALYDPIGDLAGFDREKYAALAGEFNSTSSAVQALVSDLAAVKTSGGGDDLPSGGDSPGSDDVPESNYREQYAVMVVCDDAPHQEQVFEKLTAEGFVCKVVVT